MMGNLNEAISVDDAVNQLVKDPDQAPEEQLDVTDKVESDDDETDAVETGPETDESDASEEAEAQSDETEDTDDGEDDPIFEIETVNGTEKVALSDLVEGRMLKADYTRKTMELAEGRKKLEAERQDTSHLKQQLNDALSYWAASGDQEPNWSELAQTLSPQEFNLQRANWEDRQRKVQQATQLYQDLQAESHAERLRDEYEKLLETFPEWRDPKAAQAAVQTLVDAGGDYGFAPDEVSAIVDHRMIRVLQDAARYRALQKAKPKVARKVHAAPKKLKPGAKPTKEQGVKAARQKQRSRLKETGSVDDAIDLLFD